MNTEHLEDAAATVIIGQKVVPGRGREYEEWQQDLNAAAADYAGYLGAEISPPTLRQTDWVVVYRFDSIAHLQAWMNSATRQRFLDTGSEYFDGPATQQVIRGGTQPADPLVTVVVTHRVHPDHVDGFLEWQRHLNEEESKFEGFRGTELFRPIEGLQDEWTTLYRFDDAEHLDAWLTSAKRREVLAEGEKFKDSNCARSTTRSAVGSRSRRTARRRRRPPRPKPPSRSGSACIRPSCC